MKNAKPTHYDGSVAPTKLMEAVTSVKEVKMTSDVRKRIGVNPYFVK